MGAGNISNGLQQPIAIDYSSGRPIEVVEPETVPGLTTKTTFNGHSHIARTLAVTGTGAGLVGLKPSYEEIFINLTKQGVKFSEMLSGEYQKEWEGLVSLATINQSPNLEAYTTIAQKIESQQYGNLDNLDRNIQALDNNPISQLVRDNVNNHSAMCAMRIINLSQSAIKNAGNNEKLVKGSIEQMYTRLQKLMEIKRSFLLS